MSEKSATAANVIELKKVTKSFGSLKALDDVSFTVKQGQVHGFLGLNGAGKTTTIKLLMNFIRPTAGTVQIFGKDAYKASTELKRRIGYLSGDFELYGNLNGDQYLRYIANLRGAKDYDHLESLCRDLEVVLDRKIGSLSRGNKQKIGLVAALMDDPDLLILDEPTTGLDPLMQQKFYQVVRAHAKRGKTVFMSSHIISEIQEICDQVTFMKKGKVTKTVAIDELRSTEGRHVVMRAAKGVRFVEPLPRLGVTNVKSSKERLEFDVKKVDRILLKWMASQSVDDVSITEQSLEDLFLKLYMEDK